MDLCHAITLVTQSCNLIIQLFRAWSALGFMVTNIIQSQTTKSIGMLYLADFVDGCSSCMLPLCQAFITDVSEPSKLATNLGIFQGLSAVRLEIFSCKL